MLRFLRIHHLAVIDSVEVEFGPGLNVLTGETGAGKSILVEAIGLILGGRASGDLVRTGEGSATVEAIVETAGEELLIRREVTAQGRSRGFINGSLAPTSTLKELSVGLIELHGQHEHQTLLDPSSHLGVLDAFGALEALATPTRAAFESLQTLAAELARVRGAVAARDARQELARFQLAELDRAALRGAEPDEDTQLAATRQVLATAERVERLCVESYSSLYESDGAVLAGLGGVWRRVAELAALDARFQPYIDAREGIKSQLEDLALFLRRYADGIDASPARLQQIEERLALLERLKRKYGPTLADVIARRDALRREIVELEQGDERLADLDRQYAEARRCYLAAAQALGDERRLVAADFSRQLEALLADLALDQSRFEVRFAPDPADEAAWTAAGIDRAEFYLSPNPGEDLRPLARIVSGGELSRIMLAIKTLITTSRQRASEGSRAEVTAGSIAGPGEEGPWQSRAAGGMIFDEVDAGIGGRVADVVGRKLRALGSTFQVLCITHLPQIAACADSHYRIEKRVAGGRTLTTMTRLDPDARVEEISRMLGGAAVTDQIRASARELLARHRSDGVGYDGIASRAAPKGESERAKAKVRGQPQRPRRTERP